MTLWRHIGIASSIMVVVCNAVTMLSIWSPWMTAPVMLVLLELLQLQTPLASFKFILLVSMVFSRADHTATSFTYCKPFPTPLLKKECYTV